MSRLAQVSQLAGRSFLMQGVSTYHSFLTAGFRHEEPAAAAWESTAAKSAVSTSRATTFSSGEAEVSSAKGARPNRMDGRRIANVSDAVDN